MHKRLLYNDLLKKLPSEHILLIIGARQTGKTTLMHQLESEVSRSAKGVFFLTLEDKEIRASLDEHPNKLFQFLPPLDQSNRNYLFIDEIQYLEDPSNFLKYHYDLNKSYLKLIVSGSSNFYIDKKFNDSLAGRKRLFHLNTLSLEELLVFKNRDELLPYLNAGNIPGIYYTEMEKFMMEYMIFGGYPEVVTTDNNEEKIEILKEIALSYVKKDAIEAELKSPELYLQLLRILSSQVGSLYNTNSIAKDVNTGQPTVNKYISAMIKSHHITQIAPFYGNMAKEIRKMPKVYLNDLGLRNFFVNDFSPIGLRKDIGMLFENFVFRRFLDKNDHMDIQFWRTQKQQEVDFIIQRNKAFEVKFSETKFNIKKYNYFNSVYPDMELKLISFKNVLSISLTV